MSSLPSFFLPKEFFHDQMVVIHSAEIIRQMRKVFRMKPGDGFVALDGSGHEYTCVIDALARDSVRALVREMRAAVAEPSPALFLYPSLIRRERFTLILEKCTELGVAEYVPIAATRSPYHDISPHLRTRWETIIREGAEVARRGVLPKLAPVTTLADAIAQIPQDEPIIVLSTISEEAKTVRDIPAMTKEAKRVHLFLGPEGDYTAEEYASFRECGGIPFSLGSRIVRSETAAIAAVALFITHG